MLGLFFNGLASCGRMHENVKAENNFEYSYTVHRPVECGQAETAAAFWQNFGKTLAECVFERKS